VGPIGKAGSRVGVDVELLQFPARVHVLLTQHRVHIPVRPVAEEPPGAARVRDQQRSQQGQRHKSQSVGSPPLTRLARLTASLVGSQGSPALHSWKRENTALPISAKKFRQLESREPESAEIG